MCVYRVPFVKYIFCKSSQWCNFIFTRYYSGTGFDFHDFSLCVPIDVYKTFEYKIAAWPSRQKWTPLKCSVYFEDSNLDSITNLEITGWTAFLFSSYLANWIAWFVRILRVLYFSSLLLADPDWGTGGVPNFLHNQYFLNFMGYLWKIRQKNWLVASFRVSHSIYRGNTRSATYYLRKG